ncbi:MAG: hypothetical protein LBD11_04785 [Candidatus Peribacteria bacterium]|jgi:hypothetical protein|nr:hypothetical protein [Candidatus Peribacteria bacterium]
MQYEKAGIIMSCLILVVGGISGATSQREERSIIDVQTTLETALKFSEIRVTQRIPYPTIYAILEEKCDDEAIKDAKALAKTMQDSVAKKINTQTTKSELSKRFSSLKGLLLAINSPDEPTFCKQKYLFYSLLQQTQDLYLGVEDSTKIAVSSTKINTATTKASSVNQVSTSKVEAIKESSHGSAPEVTTEKSYLTLVNNKENLTTPAELAIALRTETQLQKEIGLLIAYGFLGKTDLKTLEEKINIQYVQGCGTTKGSYHMTQKTDGTNKKFKQINLNINLCETESYRTNFNKYVRQILVHELGHYFFYFKDSRSTEFAPICWTGGKQNCSSEDFVSTYAMKNADEDYAESFAHWYLEKYTDDSMIVDQAHGSASVDSPKLKEKAEYFEKAYGR